ncbi:hypothetical protein ACFQ71_41620, partial [Streptomyces sp. NPDC056534]
MSTTCTTDRLRRKAGRDTEPSTAVIDSQSLRAAETVAGDSRGWEAGKKVLGGDTRGSDPGMP